MHGQNSHHFAHAVLIISSVILSVTGQYSNSEIVAVDGFTKVFNDLFSAFSDLMVVVPNRVIGRQVLPRLTQPARPRPKPEEIEKKENQSNIYDCFGLGNDAANALETWLRGNTNSTDDVKVKFYIKTRKGSKRIEITDNDINLDQIDFDIRRNTYVIVHGYLSNGEVDWIIDMENTLLKWDDVNVISADWSDRHFSINYFKSAQSTETVGNQIATLLEKIKNHAIKKNGYDQQSRGRLHLIGHSLGAHICGYAAHEMKRRKNDWIVQRVTGLDPAKICFESSDPVLKLNSDDAPFVDVIHTNARDSVIEGLSLFDPLGHFDFYPNGGKHQPGCTRSNFILLDSIKIPGLRLSETICDHGKASLYFIESINNLIAKNCTFLAKPWDLTEESAEKMLSDSYDQSCIEMGINSESYFKGNKATFFSLTSGSPPFCKIKTEKEIKEVKKILVSNKRKKR